MTSIHIRSAVADVYANYIQVQCQAELGVINIHEFGYADQERYNIGLHQKDILWNEHKLVMHGSLVEINDDFSHQKTHSRSTKCAMNDETVYTITIKAYLFNENPEGQCGGTNSFAISIQEQDNLILKEFSLWDTCIVSLRHNNSEWRTTSVTLDHFQNQISFHGLKTDYNIDSFPESEFHKTVQINNLENYLDEQTIYHDK